MPSLCCREPSQCRHRQVDAERDEDHREADTDFAPFVGGKKRNNLNKKLNIIVQTGQFNTETSLNMMEKISHTSIVFVLFIHMTQKEKIQY